MENEISTEQKLITIPMSEYKELLITKGKYEALKEYFSRNTQPIIIKEPTNNGDWKPDLSKFTSVTCG